MLQQCLFETSQDGNWIPWTKLVCLQSISYLDLYVPDEHLGGSYLSRTLETGGEMDHSCLYNTHYHPQFH